MLKKKTLNTNYQTTKNMINKIIFMTKTAVITTSTTITA